MDHAPRHGRHRLEGKLEPESASARTADEAALTSLAISMKRIADALEGAKIVIQTQEDRDAQRAALGLPPLAKPRTETLTHLSIPQLRRMNRTLAAGEVAPDDEQDAIRFRELETWGLMEAVPGYVTGYKLTALGVETSEAYDAYSRDSTPGGQPETDLKAILARVTRTVTHA